MILSIKKIIQSEYLPLRPIRRLMMHNGALLVAKDGVEILARFLCMSGEIITESAQLFATNDHRKKITRKDILLAIKYFDVKKVIEKLKTLG